MVSTGNSKKGGGYMNISYVNYISVDDYMLLRKSADFAELSERQ